MNVRQSFVQFTRQTSCCAVCHRILSHTPIFVAVSHMDAAHRCNDSTSVPLQKASSMFRNRKSLSTQQIALRVQQSFCRRFRWWLSAEHLDAHPQRECPRSRQSGPAFGRNFVSPPRIFCRILFTGLLQHTTWDLGLCDTSQSKESEKEPTYKSNGRNGLAHYCPRLNSPVSQNKNDGQTRTLQAI